MIENEIMELLNELKKKDWCSAFNMWKQKMKKLIDHYFENK